MTVPRIIAAILLSIVLIGLVVYFDLIGFRSPFVPGWRAIGWGPCEDGVQTAIQVCVDPRSGAAADASRCSGPTPVVTRSCVPGEEPTVRCCSISGDCADFEYQEGFSCCGINYNDYSPSSGLKCCHHGNENALNGCSTTLSNDCEDVCQ